MRHPCLPAVPLLRIVLLAPGTVRCHLMSRLTYHPKLIIFVGGTSGSVHVQTLNDNLKELEVIESKGMRLGNVSFMSC